MKHCNVNEMQDPYLGLVEKDFSKEQPGIMDVLISLFCVCLFFIYLLQYFLLSRLLVCLVHDIVNKYEDIFSDTDGNSG